MFIYAFDEETKFLLNKNGYRFIDEKTIDNKLVYIFADNPHVKMEFEKGKIMRTNLMTF